MSQALQILHGDFGRVALLDMDRSLVRHAHPHCHALLKVDGDDTRFLVGDRIVPLTDEQAVLVNAWETHAYLHDLRRCRTTILALYVEPAWLGSFRQNWAASEGPDFFRQPAGAVTPHIRRLAGDLASDMMCSRDTARGPLLPNLMIALIERFARWREHDVVPQAYAGRGDWRVRRAIRRICREPGCAGGIDDLAREAGLSRAHFYRLFEAALGVSPNVFVNANRVECAVQAIAGGGESMTALGQRLGFSAPAHFSRFFRDHVGIPPSAFRARVGA